MVKETTWSKLRELWAIRRRCKQIQSEQGEAASPRASSAVAPTALLSKPLFVCFSACFFAACLLHARDMWHHGWLPYHSAPLPLNCYWTALVILDFIAAVLLLTRPRAGLAMALLVMGSDVALNVFARFDLHLIQHAGGATLLLAQLLFFGLMSAVALYFSGRPEADQANLITPNDP
ncbi:MAG: hypothetical protein DLM52_08305 [Chthoniobacterales bacterium]|nr:MAG: hypothetical protein DLM52_08305 [Chthoniobacterales bacterium]